MIVDDLLDLGERFTVSTRLVPTFVHFRLTRATETTGASGSKYR